MTLATKLRDSKAVHAAAGAGDLAVEKIRELPETVTKLRETADKYRVDVRETRATARSGGLDYVCPAHSITILRLTAR